MAQKPYVTAAHHEHMVPDAGVVVSSERTFGLVFSAFWTVVGLLPLIHAKPARWWALAAGVVCLLAALVMPRVLRPFNLLWAKLAILLHHMVSPVALGLVFFLAFTTTGALLRLFGKDLLRLRSEPGADTYWIPRNPPGPPPETMIHQF